MTVLVIRRVACAGNIHQFGSGRNRHGESAPFTPAGELPPLRGGSDSKGFGVLERLLSLPPRKRGTGSADPEGGSGRAVWRGTTQARTIFV